MIPGIYETGDDNLPATSTEEDVARVIAEVLQLEQVGRHDNFFDLGGDSLQATQIVSRLQATHPVTLRRLFEHPSIAALAAVLDREQPGGGLPPIRRTPRRGDLPLSFAQSRMWFLEQFSPGAAGYEVAVAARLKGALDVAALQSALDAVVARHEALRTRFSPLDGSTVQVVLPAAPIALRLAEVEAEPAAETAAWDLVEALRAEPFDLQRGPLLRALLIRLADGDHLLALTIHHIASDRWSMEILGRELAVLYQAASTGAPSPLAPPEVDYVDYAVWQREWLEGSVLEGQLAYWRRQLEGVQAVELYPDHPRPPVATHDGGEVELRVDAGVAADLRALAKRMNVTLFVTLLAGFKALLVRYSHTTDIVVGTPTSGRIRQELEGMLGFLVNTLVLRSDCSADPTFAEHVLRVRDTAWSAFAHQDVPFERLVAELGLPRDPSRHPLFQVMFSVHGPFDPGGLAGLETTWTPLPATDAPFDMTVNFEEVADGSLTGRIVYNKALFERATIERLAGHLGNLLASAVADPTTPLSGLRMLSPDERHRLLEEWHGPTAAGVAACLHHLIEDQADHRPEAVAVIAPDVTLTYSELDARANRLAHHLRAHGVGPGSFVALCLERSADMVVAVLATLKAGGAFVPLDPTHPPARLAFILADTDAAVVLTHSALRSVLPPTPPTATVALIDAEPVIAQRPSDRPDCGATPDDLAYVMYTSGSTGQPKGVMVQHANVANLAFGLAAAGVVSSADRVLASSPLTFDMAVIELLVPLVLGATSVVAASLPHLDLWATARDSGVTTVQATPAAWQLAGDPPRPAALRTVISGGEPMTPWLAAKLRGFAARVWNGYGPTETTVCAVIGDVTNPAGTPPIGRPLTNTRVYVVGRSGELVPVGVPGELWIGGAGVARGYLGREELTAGRFLADPFLPGGRVYRTGDLVRWRANGNLEFLGRRDHQIKIRGHRIECAEIEAALEAHPEVADAAVTLRRDRPGQETLVAYVVGRVLANGATKPTTSDLLDHLRVALPAVMIPSTFVALDALPLTANGKLDRAALPVPQPVRPDLDAPYKAPRTPTETRLAGLFADVLHLDRVGIHDDFFDLGGHSLLATQVVSRLPTGQSLTLRALFATPTVAGLAAVLDGRAPAVEPPIAEPGPAPPLGHVHVVPGAGGSAGWLVELLGHIFSGAVDVVGLDYGFDSRTEARPPTLAEYVEGAAARIRGQSGVAGGVFGYCAGAAAALRLGQRFGAPVFALDAPYHRAATMADTESAIRRRVRNLETAGNLPPSMEGTTEDERLAWLARNWSAPLAEERLRFFRDDIRKFVFLHEQLAADSQWVPRPEFPLVMAMSKEFMEASPDALGHWRKAAPWATFEILDGGHLLAVRSARCRALLRRWAGVEE